MIKVVYIFQKAVAILIESLLMSIRVNGFLDPHHLLDGRITGITLILHYNFDFSTGLAIFKHASIHICLDL